MTMKANYLGSQNSGYESDSVITTELQNGVVMAVSVSRRKNKEKVKENHKETKNDRKSKIGWEKVADNTPWGRLAYFADSPRPGKFGSAGLFETMTPYHLHLRAG